MNGLDIKEFCNELALVAANDGDAYRHGRSADIAIDRAFREFQKRRREEEREAFREHRKALIAELASRWGASQ